MLERNADVSGGIFVLVAAALVLVSCGATAQDITPEDDDMVQDSVQDEQALIEAEVNQTYDIDVQMIDIPDDAESIARGEHIASSWGYCYLCHFGPTYTGSQSYVTYKGVFAIVAKNLTPGEGGVGSTYEDVDWVRLLRHGVRPDGTSVIGMPSLHFSNMSDEDLAGLIAYMKTLSPVDKSAGRSLVRPEAVLADLDDVEILPARFIDHDKPRPVSVEAAPTAEYGAYLVTSSPCAYCHGQELNGIPFVFRDEEFAGNLTPGGDLGEWSLETFVETLRTGVTPDGDTLPQLYMPPHIYNEMTDIELEAIFAYLQSLPALDDGY